MSDPIQPSPTVARFYIASTEEFGRPDDEGHCSGKVTLNAVSRGDQNKQWASATPSGTLTMHINNGRAFEALRAVQRAGLDVDVLLTPVPAHNPDDGHPFRQSTMPPGSSYGGEGTCGDCGAQRVDTWSERGVEKVTHKADRDAGWTPAA